jgi:hypothetical protein
MDLFDYDCVGLVNSLGRCAGSPFEKSDDLEPALKRTIEQTQLRKLLPYLW